jgi:hypothetical protein
MYTRETLERKITVLESSIETLSYQIKHLHKQVNYLQVQAWRKNKATLNKQLQKCRQKFNKYYAGTATQIFNP